MLERHILLDCNKLAVFWGGLDVLFCGVFYQLVWKGKENIANLIHINVRKTNLCDKNSLLGKQKRHVHNQ